MVQTTDRALRLRLPVLDSPWAYFRVKQRGHDDDESYDDYQHQHHHERPLCRQLKWIQGE